MADGGKKINVVELACEPWPDRWAALKEHARTQQIDLILTSEKIENQFSPGDLSLKFESHIKADAVFISPELAAVALTASKLRMRNVDQIGSALLFLKREDKLWPSSLFVDAIVKSMSLDLRALDMFSPVLVAGSNVLSDHIMFALSKIGYTKIFVTDENSEKLESQVARIKKSLFNIEVVPLPLSQITTRPGVFSLLVNTTPLSLDNKLLDELYFFNFLGRGAGVLDLTLVPIETPLLKQAKDWGAKVMSGTSVWAMFDQLLIQSIADNRGWPQVPFKGYREALEKIVSTQPFDSEPFLKRFLDRF